METTLEIRWFIRGMPPAVVQRWFKLECPGKFIARSETRKDWYAVRPTKDKFILKNVLSHKLYSQEVNLKFREGNLELKLKKQDFGIHQFGGVNIDTCEGRVEQWVKYDESELSEFIYAKKLIDDPDWIGVEKEREQKIARGVKSELTWLKINQEIWWTVAFEMSQNKSAKQKQDRCFKKLIDQACQTYYGPKLSANNSYGYSRWLLGLSSPAIPY